MSGQDVFKGALGWDDWIWWTGIGAVGLFFFLTLLCCCVCMQRAKRKGRQEALAAVQVRQREEAQREEAQVRYAQAQQARYPAGPTQEQQYKFSQQQGGSPAGAPAQFVPAGGPKKNYGPQVMANGYAMPPPQQQQYGQQQQQYGQQQQQYGHPAQQQYGQHQQQYGQHQQQYGQPQQQQQYGAQGKQPQYGAPPQQQQPPHGYYQPQQQQNVPPPQYAAPPPAPQQKVAEAPPQEYQTYAKPAASDYQRKTYQKPKPWHSKAATAAPYPSSDAVSFSSTHSDEANRSFHNNDVPFVAVTSPSGRDPELNASKIGMTLRDRIDALREGSVHENHTRISVDPQDLELPPIGAGRRSLVLAGTVLSEQSPSSSSSSRSSNKAGPLVNKKNAKPSDDQFKTARDMDDYSSSNASSKPFSTGQFDDAESYTYEQSASMEAAETRDRVGSVEF